ncbi:hypothetical protein CASFOL_033267 [Castilleja foliolosa]|uniref:RING-type E3 ubiquitin transferase n=1 Tax=Castilleja foliolosa TaxID=1961234 RepID=A0ABD3C094_9LAMI
MGDPSSPHPPPSPTRSNMPMLYYGLVVVGTAAVVLALYNLIIVRWCTNFSHPRAGRRANGPSWRFHHSNINILSSFKYKRDEVVGDESECAVCLSVFEEGEELRQLPKCKHSFHAPCIDMWLYSHINCPLCRCEVEPQTGQLRPEHSREGLLAPGTLV